MDARLSSADPVHDARASWRRLARLARRWWPHIAALAGASALVGVFEAALLGLIVRIAIALGDGQRAAAVALGPLEVRAGITTLLAAAGGLALLRLALQLIVAWLPARMAAETQARLARAVFDAYANAEWAIQAAEPDGHLQELATVHAGRAALALPTLAAGLAALVTLAALLASAFLISAGTAALLLGMATALFLLLRPLGPLQRGLAQRLSAAGLDLAAAVAEATRVAEEHHVFGTHAAQTRAVATRVQAYRGPFFRVQLLSRITAAAYQALAILLLLSGLGVLAALAAPELAALGTVVLILVRSFSYGQQAQTSYTALHELLPFVARLQHAIGHFHGHAVPPGTEPLRHIDEVTLEHVGFAYAPGRPVLEDVNVRLPAGRAIGIVGPSGAGKSTLVQLVLGLRRPTAGRVLVNGVPTERIRREDWQRRVAHVPQDPKLIRGTVADNIRFFRPLSMDDVVRAARAAHIHDEILGELGGYDAVIDHRGDTVSGGQRQRICLARALAGRPELLVLDEPTSALDARSEALILETLLELRGAVTTLVVAHRPEVLDRCDEVWELRGGRVTVRPAAPATRHAPG